MHTKENQGMKCSNLPKFHTEFAVVEHQGPPAGTTLVSTSDPLARIPHSRYWGVEEDGSRPGTPVPLPPRLVERMEGMESGKQHT